jgi:hypothetical protein
MLNEELSVSPIVKETTEVLTNIILDKAFEKFDNEEVKFSDLVHKSYVDGCFVYDLSQFDDSLRNVKVSFTIYDTMSIHEYNLLVQHSLIGNSESDFQSKTLTVVSSFIDRGNGVGDIAPNFTSEIAHELTHLYQYSQGMKKRVDLYSLVVQSLSAKDVDYRTVAKSLYYTFTHEQDAMTHQFYEFLRENQPYEQFEQVIRYSEYTNFDETLKSLKQISKDKLCQVLYNFGMSFESFNKRLHYAKKRFLGKLFRVFRLYKREYGSNINELIYTTNAMIEESKKYKNIEAITEQYIMKTIHTN